MFTFTALKEKYRLKNYNPKETDFVLFAYKKRDMLSNAELENNFLKPFESPFFAKEFFPYSSPYFMLYEKYICNVVYLKNSYFKLAGNILGMEIEDIKITKSLVQKNKYQQQIQKKGMEEEQWKQRLLEIEKRSKEKQQEDEKKKKEIDENFKILQDRL